MRPTFQNRTRPAQVFGKSVTIPEQSYTVPQLFERFRKGVPVNVEKRDPIYTDSEIDLEKVNRLSRMDKIDLAETFADQATRQKMQLEEAEEAQRLEAEENAIAEAAKRLANEKA